MQKKANIPRQRQSPFGRFLLVLVAFLGYLALFFVQPSELGIRDEAGNTLNRIADALVMPSQFDNVFGDGTQENGILDRIPLLIAAVLWLSIGYWIGRPLVEFSLRNVSRTQHICFATLAGLSILSTAVLFVGCTAGFSSRLPLVGTLVALTSAAFYLRRSVSPHSHWLFSDKMKSSADVQPDPLLAESLGGLWIQRLIPLGVCTLGGFYFLASFAPPSEYDVITYHLEAPKEFLQTGYIRFNDHNIYANMPLGAEMHAMAAMVLIGGTQGWWWGGIIGKVIIASFTLISAILIWDWVRARFGRISAWISAGLFLASPGNAHVSLAGLIDMVLAAYVLAMLAAASHAFQSIASEDDARNGEPRCLLLLSLFAGAAGACKYPGIVFAIVPLVSLWLFYAIRRRTFRTIAVEGGWIVLGLCLTCLPWLAKNTIETGNPVYPLAYEVFGGRDLTEARAEQWQAAHRPPVVNGSAYSPAALLQSIQQFFLGSRFASPSLNFLAICGLLLCWRQPNGHEPTTRWLRPWLGMLAWILIIWWVATHRIDRFWLPALPMISIMAAAGIYWIGKEVSSGLATAIGFVGIALGTLYSVAGFGPIDNRIFVSLAALEQESLVESEESWVNPATAWINRSLTLTDKVLSIGEAKAYLYRVPIVYATCFNDTPGEDWLSEQAPDAQLRRLQAEGITHFMVDWFEIERFRQPGNYGFSAWPTREDVDAMIESGVLERMDHPLNPKSVDIFKVAGAREP